MPEFLQRHRPSEPRPRRRLRLLHAPIVEAVVDIDCDLPPAFDLGASEAEARRQLAGTYPKFRTQLLQQAQFQYHPDQPPTTSLQQGLQALQFYKSDELQLTQFRVNGFSFNRLKDYKSLDEYLPEIRRNWELFLALAKPLQVRKLGLRFINRMMLPARNGGIELDEFLRIGPRLPDEEGMRLNGFLHQHSMTETATRNRVNTILTSQPREGDFLPLIFDIETLRNVAIEPKEWEAIADVIGSLRDLKNRVFEDTLTEQCLKLFQPLD